jgi:hypothetical protein
MATQKAKERDEAIERLREWVKPGDTIYTILRHKSSSGMSRVIDMLKIEDNRVMTLGWNAAKALGDRFDNDREGVRVSGAGMDMGFHLVMNLGYVLFPDGFGCVGEHCPSNDHFNGDRDYTPHGNGMTPHRREVLIGADHWHTSGGYALNHKWL